VYNLPVVDKSLLKTQCNCYARPQVDNLGTVMHELATVTHTVAQLHMSSQQSHKH